MSDETLSYREPSAVGKEEALKILNNGDPIEIARNLVNIAFHEEDFNFASSIIFRCAESENETVRAAAIVCIGHLARIHNYLPENPTLQILEKAFYDSNILIQIQADDVADDIEMFVPGLAIQINAFRHL